MILSRADALELHGDIVSDPAYVEGENPAADTTVTLLERVIASGHDPVYLRFADGRIEIFASTAP